MAASRSDINAWLDRLYDDDDVTHMIVVCDSFDWEDYPVYVTKGENVREKESEYKDKSMQRVMEVYSASHDRDSQMTERRAFHYD